MTTETQYTAATTTQLLAMDAEIVNRLNAGSPSNFMVQSLICDRVEIRRELDHRSFVDASAKAWLSTPSV